MARSHYHLRFRGSFGGEGLVIIRVVVRSSPELVLLAWSGWVWLCGYSIERFRKLFPRGVGR